MTNIKISSTKEPHFLLIKFACVSIYFEINHSLFCIVNFDRIYFRPNFYSKLIRYKHSENEMNAI